MYIYMGNVNEVAPARRMCLHVCPHTCTEVASAGNMPRDTMTHVCLRVGHKHCTDTGTQRIVMRHSQQVQVHQVHRVYLLAVP